MALAENGGHRYSFVLIFSDNSWMAVEAEQDHRDAHAYVVSTPTDITWICSIGELLDADLITDSEAEELKAQEAAAAEAEKKEKIAKLQRKIQLIEQGYQ